MNISVKNNPVLARSLTGNQMKSTQEKLERRQTMENRVAALEQQKVNLKNKQCNTLDEIAEKLEMFHSYEDEIAAVKKSFNSSEMFHTMDEARERGEKIAEAAEKSKPKTKEERKKEAIEEAAGTEEKSGVLSELLEEMDDRRRHRKSDGGNDRRSRKRTDRGFAGVSSGKTASGRRSPAKKNGICSNRFSRIGYVTMNLSKITDSWRNSLVREIC